MKQKDLICARLATPPVFSLLNPKYVLRASAREIYACHYDQVSEQAVGHLPLLHSNPRAAFAPARVCASGYFAEASAFTDHSQNKRGIDAIAD